MNIKRLFCLCVFLSVICISESFAQENKWILFLKDTDKLEYYYDSSTIKITDNYTEVWYRVDNYSPDVERQTGLVRIYCKKKEALIIKHVIYYTDRTKSTDDYPRGKSRILLTSNSLLDYLSKAVCN
ncbi:MAG: hypothetical protein L0Y76_10080 [Ignavibacteria bacterium]|nr:hypothetical protein [Ignavibacteria bacterium]